MKSFARSGLTTASEKVSRSFSSYNFFSFFGVIRTRLFGSLAIFICVKVFMGRALTSLLCC